MPAGQIEIPRKDSIHPDSLLNDSTRVDSLRAKTLLKKPKKKNRMEAKVDYAAKDSIRFEIKGQKVFLYKEGNIKYKDISLKAAYVEIDFPKNLVYATGIKDSVGKLVGTPEFQEGAQTFKSKIINYNYTTKRGFINTVFTKQDEGYLHGTIVKKMENNITYLKSGSYTTCDLEENPHFAFRFNRGKVIPGKRVITGPAFMDIAGVPTPLVIPFGFFPNRSGRRSGILIGTYNESANRGFYFENFGYYWGISQYMDLTVHADIYTRGSWAIKPALRYNNRYHYNGAFNFTYAVNLIGESGTPGFQKSKDFQVRWIHTQDPKARPNSTFSANVNILSSSFNKNTITTSAQTYLSNQFQSSISYSTSFAGKYYLNLSAQHSQNTLNKSINITLPQLNFSVNQFYPFRRQNHVGKMLWFEQISMKYNTDLENRYATTDANFMKGNWPDSLQNGMKHSIPINGTFKVLKYFNWGTSMQLNDRMYTKTIHRYYQADTIVNGKDTIRPGYKTRSVSGFANAFDFSLSTSLSTTVYGMFQFKSKLLKAIRHVMRPSVSFSYTPNWGAAGLGYYHQIENDTNKKNPTVYSIFQNSIYGGPPGQKSGTVSFNIGNNLEMKVRNRKDTVSGTRKIPLLDDLSFSCSYDVARDSVNWSPINVSGRTTIIKGLAVQYRSVWDMYARDSLGRRLNKTMWDAHHQFLRLDNTSWSTGFSYSLSSEKFKKKTTSKGTTMERKDVVDYYDYYVDFDIPWSFSFNYTFSYNKVWNIPQNKRVAAINQTLGFSGQLNITPKWKVSLTSGWDFVSKQLSYTSIDVYRDLHCWEMRFGWIPKGGQQSWNFSINVKAPMLQDLKLNKKKDFRDYSN